MCLVYLFISAQTGCVMNDSVLTQVEGYSHMRGRDGERQRQTVRERER